MTLAPDSRSVETTCDQGSCQYWPKDSFALPLRRPEEAISASGLSTSTFVTDPDAAPTTTGCTLSRV